MRKTALLLLMLVATTAFSQQSQQGLDMGYVTPWLGKTFYNPGRTFDLSWPQLCKASAGDAYSVALPHATSDAGSVQVQFKTPINIVYRHRYRLSFQIRVAQGSLEKATVILAENEDDNVEILTKEVALAGGNAATVVEEDILGKTITDMKLWLLLGGNEAGTTVVISNISLIDRSYGNKELWQGTSFYNQCYYEVDGNRVSDPQISGTTTDMSWTLPDFDDSMWDDTMMPIGNAGFMPEVQTIWEGNEYNNYWIRRTFTLDEVNTTSGYTLDVLHDDTYAIYVNGHLIDSAEDWTVGKNVIHFKVPSAFLRKGTNVIACYQQQNFGGKFFDCGLTITPNMYDEYDDINPAEALVANELQVANIDQYIDYSFNYGAWLELYNTTDKTVNLGGIYLSDDPANTTKYMIPWTYGVVGPHGYVTLFFDHNAADGTYGETADRQIRFKLNEEGGTLYVSDYNGNPFVELPYPPSVSRCSYARTVDGTGNWSYTGEPTPGASNNGSDFAEQRLEAPQVDVDSKLFTSSFKATVAIPAGVTLRYTTDGSTPTKESRVSETGVFDINQTSSLRLRFFAKGKLPSQVVTRSYIYRDKDYYLPVISITTDNENLYGDSIGVYCQGVNGVVGHGNNSVRNNLNMDWERPVNVEYITPGNEMVVNQEAEFTISGGWSRLYAPSSFKLKARNIYEGQKAFSYPFFATKPYNKYKELLVRNGGNDNDSQAHGRIKDAIIQETITTSGVYLDCQALQPTHVFFNGKYIGMLNLRDPANKFFGTANYGYDKDEMDAFEYSNGYFQKAGDNKAFREWVSLSAQASNDAVYQTLREKVDMDEFINYMAGITYIGSSDWICNNNNSKGFRSLPDGKFHMILFDVDWGFSNSQGLLTLMDSNANDLIRIFKNSLNSKEFKRQFVDSYCLMGGSVFTSERSKAIGDSLATLFSTALSFEGKQPWTSYNELVPRMTNTANQANRIQVLRNTMGLGKGLQANLRANIPEAQLLLNGLNIPLNKFDGTLFPPFTLEATAPSGYDFVGWKAAEIVTMSVISKGDEWSYYDGGSLDGVNWKTGNQVSWKTGATPIGYGKQDIATETVGNLPTYYFRTSFSLSKEPADDDEFELNFVADDGFVVYVNGVEATRYLMPDGEPSYSTFATTYASNNPDAGSVKLLTSLFRKGRNFIAVEVHNNKLASTDIYWNAELLHKSSSGEYVGTDRQLSVTESNDLQLVAMFKPVDDEYLSYATSPVVINEVSAANTIYVNDYQKKNDWIELYNTTSQPIDISGMFISDDANDPEKYQILADESAPGLSTVIPAHGYLLVWADRLDPLFQLHTNFKLANSDGECVMITAADGSWTDKLEYDMHTGEETVGRFPDGGKRVFKMTRPTIGARNQLTTYAEWLYGEDVNFDPSVLDGVDLPEASLPQAVETEYYMLDGMRVLSPVKGVNIVRTKLADGSVVTRKVVIR
ncbi:MAG: lamin tail domain-containing protein [Prevotella sp.]|nr:lamin tail domain-containing protein [Prevotella sp.]